MNEFQDRDTPKKALQYVFSSCLWRSVAILFVLFLIAKALGAQTCYTSSLPYELQPNRPKPVKQSGRAYNDQCLSVTAYVSWYTVQQFQHNETRIRKWAEHYMNQADTLYTREGVNFDYDIVIPTEPDFAEGLTAPGPVLTEFGKRFSPYETGTTIIGYIGSDTLGGGVAWVDVLCYEREAYTPGGTYITRVGASFVALDIDTILWPLSANRYDNQVIAHEIGHNVGLPHTFDCVWGPGDTLALDDCAIHPFCSTIDPPEPGTVMSYCHIGNSLDLLGKGFGYYPGIRMHELLDSRQCVSMSQTPIVVTGTMLDTYNAPSIEITNATSFSDVRVQTDELIINGPTQIAPRFTMSRKYCEL